MAAAVPSPLASSTEKTNGAKLSRLLIDGGTTVLRNTFDKHHPPARLAADLIANFSKLDTLFRKRVICKAQWQQLFPPNGAKPDSNSFDITLLFLLLNTICGVSPPPSGWHTKPPPSDTSPEANLARIKIFRNELYGHVSSTGVDTPTFKTLWQEISAALISLGLDQAEIDRLQAERCGEDDYINVLTDWEDSERKIKSELKEVKRDVNEVLRTHLEDRKTQQESSSRLEQVHEIVTKTHRAINEALQNHSKDHSSLRDTISKLDEIHHIENETHDAIKELRQTKLEDHKTLQDGVSKLEGISQTQTKTQQAVEEVHETIQAGLREIKQELESLSKKREMDRADELLRNLAKSEFKGDIEYHAQRFQDGTREWIFKRIDDWLDERTSQNRAMVISGNAGMGKSVISAVTCKRMQEAGRLSGSHFCQHKNVRYRSPQLMLQSLASHLSHTLSEYKKSLLEQLSRNLGPVELNSMGVEELFALLFKEPLNNVKDPGRNILMVIDGLDESEYQGRNELLDVIANQFSRLPQWIRFFVTTRSEINIADSLKHLQPLHLDENQEENLKDIRLFFEMQLSPNIAVEQKDVLLTKLVEKSEGVFLYAFFLIDHIQVNFPLLTHEQLESSLPLGISSVYHSHFKRLENELLKELKIDEDQVLRFLCAFTASREPLPVAFVSRLLNPNGRSLSAQRRINKAIACISSLLPVRNECLHFFHKSIKDWLTNTSCYGRHDFTVDEKEGHEILFDLCRNELDNIKRRGVHKPPFSDTERYALQHGVQHMIELSESGESPRLCDVEALVNTYVTDLELIYAKLCVNSTGSSEDISSVQKHIKPSLLSERSQSLLISLLKVLRKHSYLLRDHPQLWFQSLINEGPPELSSEAAIILQNRLPSLPYMKYLDNQEENGAIKARFYCSDTVACFDVSPELDYMVCECRDGTIHLWSLETANLEWSRPSLINREFQYVHPGFDVVSDGGAYRKIDYRILTFYRSVVFHPRGKSVLPGTLRSVYTLEGDCIPLYPYSNCTFSHCAFPTDKRTILTDCFDNPKEVALWSMESGEELRRITWNDIITSFAVSNDGSEIAFADVTGSIYLVESKGPKHLFKCDVACGMMHFTKDSKALVCGYLPYKIEDGLGYGQYGWVWYRNPALILRLFKTSWAQPPHDFFLWPIEPKTRAIEYWIDDGLLLGRVKNVGSVFSSLVTGFYKWLGNGTALVGSPSFKYVAAIHVDSLSEATRQVVKEVVFSSQGDVIYSITSKNESRVSAVLVTVLRMSSQEILVEKSFTCPSLSLVPVKEGVVLCLKDEVPELWNFELTECIRQIPKLKGAKKLIRLSDELIGCEWYRRTLTPEEFSDFGYPAETEDSLELHAEDDLMEVNKALHHDNSADEETSDDSSTTDTFVEFGNFLIKVMNTLFFCHFVDIVNVISGECVSSMKTRASDDRHEFVSCNSQNQLLVCTRDEFDDGFLHGEQLTVTLRNNNSFSCVWERKAARYDERFFTPHFMFSPEEEFLVTWASFSSGYGVHILDAKTGETQRTFLKDQDDIVDCKFVANGESLVCCSKDNFLRLFNIRSGDLLSVLDVEEQPCCLGACVDKPLVAIGLWGARLKFVHVKLPSDEDAEGKKGFRGKQN
ncbi:uncharacterized protein [Montipora capricornis]|uniref:uncharacterized protein n=1 Tax=Montipora capricornis TaxID=246305 RepID=UPI0035F1F831